MKGEGRKLNAETTNVHREEKQIEESDWSECEESIGQGSTDSYYCQGVLLSSIIRMRRAEVERLEGLGGDFRNS